MDDSGIYWGREEPEVPDDGIYWGREEPGAEVPDESERSRRRGRRPSVEMVSTPPLTNRGCFTPPTLTGDSGKRFLEFGVDYLRLTIFEPLEAVRDGVERHLLEPAGASLLWDEKGPLGRWGRRLEQQGSESWILQLREPINSQTTYTMLEMRGEGCALFQAHLPGFLRSLDEWASRWSGKRCDVKWDGHEISPAVLDEAHRAGQFVSRSLSIADRDWRANFHGETAYLGNRSGKTKHLRCYNARGFNRLELELSEDWADSILRKLAGSDVGQWPLLALGYLLGTVDYRDTSAATRAHRASRLPWWSSFVGQAEKVKYTGVVRESPALRPLPIGLADEWVKRNRRQLLKMIQGLGADWLAKRAVEWCRQRGEITADSGRIVSDQLRQDVEQLALYRNSGLCGTVYEELPI